MEDLVLERIVENFISGVEYARTLYWYLAKLGSLVFSIREDYCNGNDDCTERTLLKLSKSSDPRLRKALEPLSCYWGEIEERVMNDARFKGLRRYLPVLAQIASSIQCSGEKRLSLIDRPPLFILESARPFESPEYISYRVERHREEMWQRMQGSEAAEEIGKRIGGVEDVRVEAERRGRRRKAVIIVFSLAALAAAAIAAALLLYP